MQIFLEDDSYQSAKQAAELIGVTSRRIRQLASQGRIVGAILHVRDGWLIPNIVNVKPGKRGPEFTGHVRKQR